MTKALFQFAAFTLIELLLAGLALYFLGTTADWVFLSLRSGK